MASNWDKIKEKYQNAEEEKRASLSRYASLEFKHTIKHVSEYIKMDTAVIELGCGLVITQCIFIINVKNILA